MDENKSLISIIVISYNTCEMTLACLRSVFQETQADFEIIVLDNASQDDSVKAIRQEFGNQVRLIASSENLGFAAGNNEAIKYAKGDYILLLNPDTVVLDAAIDRLLDFARSNPQAEIWGGRTLFADRSLNPASCWSRQTLWSLLMQALGFTSLFRNVTLFNPEGLGGWRREGIRQVDIVSGCFLLVTSKFWKQLEGFRAIFFMYGEEADFCLRARNYGARPMVSSEATIVHYAGASEKVRADKLVRLLKAKMLLICEHFPVRSRWLGRQLLALWPLSRLLAYRILRMFPGKHKRENEDVWAEVVSRRKEWDV